MRRAVTRDHLPAFVRPWTRVQLNLVSYDRKLQVSRRRGVGSQRGAVGLLGHLTVVTKRWRFGGIVGRATRRLLRMRPPRPLYTRR
jgi:hypothetical protein